MKSIAIFMLCIAVTIWAQESAPMPPETVVATADGEPITAGELMLIFRMSPPEAQKNFLKDSKAFVQWFGRMRKLAKMAEQAHLDQQSPLKEELAASRRQFLASAQAAAMQDSVATTIQAADQKKFYQDHLDRYTQAKVKVLLVSFSASPASQSGPKIRKALSEGEAKAKAEKLLGQIRAGADFVKLVKEHSDDSESVGRDGDFGALIQQTDNKMPENLMRAIFALEPGQTSEPVRVSTGFYLLRLEELIRQPYEKVSDEIFLEIQKRRFEESLQKIEKSLDVKIVDERFFSRPK